MFGDKPKTDLKIPPIVLWNSLFWSVSKTLPPDMFPSPCKRPSSLHRSGVILVGRRTFKRGFLRPFFIRFLTRRSNLIDRFIRQYLLAFLKCSYLIRFEPNGEDFQYKHSQKTFSTAFGEPQWLDTP